MKEFDDYHTEELEIMYKHEVEELQRKKKFMHSILMELGRRKTMELESY